MQNLIFFFMCKNGKYESHRCFKNFNIKKGEVIMLNKKSPHTFFFFMVALLLYFSNSTTAYDKKSLVERFTNCSCGPCATINNSWYNATTADFINSGSISHIVYNVDWPSSCDPMHLLNAADNNKRRGYYGVNSVPWIEINGNTIATNQSAFTNAVTSGNSEYSPFNIVLTPEMFSNNVIDVKVKIIRDPADNTTFQNAKLRIALTERQLGLTSGCCNNGESVFYSVSRKMLPDGNGIEFTIPAPGDSTELSLLYIPTTEFLESVNLDSIRVVAFIQDDATQEMYQSTMENLQFSNHVNAAFQVEEDLGAPPFTVNFSDFSTGTDTTNIISWEWDFDNDGNVDSQDSEPSWIFNDEQSYTVSLTVSDGQQQHTRTIANFITVLGATSNILVVNGIDYGTYTTEMENFYNSSACFGDHQVDVWDLFGDQGFDYSANSNIQQINQLSRTIPSSILNLYQKVIWIGNSYGGDDAFYNPSQVLNYVGQGGSFLLATREGAEFFSVDLRDYCGITSMSGLSDLTQLIALDNNLVNMAVTQAHSRVQFAFLDAGSEAIPIFDADTSNSWIAGFRIQKNNDGAFIYIAGRPYRLDNAASFQNYNYIIDNWMNYIPVGVENENTSEIISEFHLYQNYPNPFNPSTRITYSIPNSSLVTLKIYDVLGKEIEVLVDEYQSANTYSVIFNANELSTGIYFYKLQAGEYLTTKKMILVK
jgi:PKD repeat protein